MSSPPKPQVSVYAALGDATRCRIVEILAAGPVPVHRLADAFTISRPAISRHLRVLKAAGLVAEVKKGRENVYALKPARLGKAFAWLETLRGAAPAKGTPPAVAKPRETPAPAKIVRTQMGFDF